MFDPRLYRRPATAEPGEPGPLATAAAAPRRAWRGLRALLPLLGPAFVVSVAYVDPGNFATNVSGGARYGVLLLWVVLAANVVAMLVQYLSAKLGLATGCNLPELCRDRYPAPVTWGLWLQAELVAMATDLAEFVGAAIALNLLFDVPLLPAGGVVAVVSLAILALRPGGRRRFDVVIVGLLAVVLAGFLYQVVLAAPPVDTLDGFVPRLGDRGSLLLAAGIVGATVMPHVVYLHSALTQEQRSRDAADRRRALRAQRLDIAVALGIAGVVNMAILVVAAAVFHQPGGAPVETLDAAYDGFATAVGRGAAVAFGLALLAAGLASASVGTFAGQVVMQGFLRRRVPIGVRRLVTMAPALLVLGLGGEPTAALVLSQVVLSFGIPFALVPLVLLTGRRDVMGDLVNRRTTTATAWLVAVLIVGLNAVLLVRQATG